MTDNLYRPRSTSERLKYESDEQIIYDEYTQRLIEDQEIYDTENEEFESSMGFMHIEYISEE